MTDSKIMTILICFHSNTFRNFKHYDLFYVTQHFKHCFPDLLYYNRFIEVESRTSVPLALFLNYFVWKVYRD